MSGLAVWPLSSIGYSIGSEGTAKVLDAGPANLKATPTRLKDTCFPCSLFFKKEMELSLVGLQNAGKTSLVTVLSTGAFHEDMIPTVGFNMRKVTKGAVTIKLWDLGGQVGFLAPRKYSKAVVIS